MDSEPAKVTPAALAYLADPANTVYLSVASIWEIVIKVQTGKLALRADIDTIVADNLSQTPLRLLPIRYDHVLALRGLPPIHKDPFDRMLVAQAVAENALILTDDPLVRQYPVPTDW